MEIVVALEAAVVAIVIVVVLVVEGHLFSKMKWCYRVEAGKGEEKFIYDVMISRALAVL